MYGNANVFTVLLASISLFHFHPSLAQQQHEIEFILSHSASSTAIMFQYYGDQLYTIDTFNIVDEQLMLKADTSLTHGLYRMYFPEDDLFFEFIVTEDQSFRMRTLFPDIIGDMIVIGSEENQMFYQDLQFIQKKRKEIHLIRKELAKHNGEEATVEDVKLKHAQIEEEIIHHRIQLIQQYPNLYYTQLLSILTQSSPTYREIASPASGDISAPSDTEFSFQFIDFTDSRILYSPAIVSLIESYLHSVVSADDSSSLHQAIHQLLAEAQINPEVYRYCIFFLLNKFGTEQYQHTYQYLWETYVLGEAQLWKGLIEIDTFPKQAELLDAFTVGDKAPEILLRDESDHFVSLYLTEKPYTVLVIGDHRETHFQEIYKKLQRWWKDTVRESPILLYYVDVGTNTKVWQQWVSASDRMGIHVQDHSGRSGIEKKYDLRTLPRFFLLDEEKRVLVHTKSLEEIYPPIQEILQKEP